MALRTETQTTGRGKCHVLLVLLKSLRRHAPSQRTRMRHLMPLWRPTTHPRLRLFAASCRAEIYAYENCGLSQSSAQEEVEAQRRAGYPCVLTGFSGMTCFAQLGGCGGKTNFKRLKDGNKCYLHQESRYVMCWQGGWLEARRKPSQNDPPVYRWHSRRTTGENHLKSRTQAVLCRRRHLLLHLPRTPQILPSSTIFISGSLACLHRPGKLLTNYLFRVKLER